MLLDPKVQKVIFSSVAAVATAVIEYNNKK